MIYGVFEHVAMDYTSDGKGKYIPGTYYVIETGDHDTMLVLYKSIKNRCHRVSRYETYDMLRIEFNIGDEVLYSKFNMGKSKAYKVVAIKHNVCDDVTTYELGTRFGNISAKSEILRLTKRCQRNRRLEELGI